MVVICLSVSTGKKGTRFAAVWEVFTCLSVLFLSPRSPSKLQAGEDLQPQLLSPTLWTHQDHLLPMKS